MENSSDRLRSANNNKLLALCKVEVAMEISNWIELVEFIAVDEGTNTEHIYA